MPTSCVPAPPWSLLLLLAATAPPRAAAPDPTPADAGNCGMFGESNAVPPVPGKSILTCGGSPIVSVLYAVYGQPKGKCGGADFGSGSASSFEDTNPQCKGKDVTAKFESLCVGKESCTAACGSNEDPIPCNVFFGKAGAADDPCPNIPKWAAVVVECPSSWGWFFLLFLGLGLAGYVGGFAAHAHKVQGKPLDASALPHPLFWAEVRSLVEDGVAFAKARATSGPQAGGATATTAEKAGSDESAGLLEAQEGEEGYGSAEAATGSAAAAAEPAEAGSDSDGGDSLVE